MAETQGRAGPEFAAIFDRELERLAGEVEAYEDERDLWRCMGAQKNPSGTLVLHLVGNLEHYVGAELGATGYVRDRPAEFTDRGVPREELLDRIQKCRDVIGPVLEGLSDEVLDRTYPGDAPARLAEVSTRGYLVHLTWHIGWHLGHIYYHRLALSGA